MACCKGAEYGDWCDGVDIAWTDPETGKEYCLFHAPAEHKGMDEDNFAMEIDISIQHCLKKRNNHLKLDGAIFSTPILFKNIEFLSISLKDTIFLDGVIFENITFACPLNFSELQLHEFFTISNCKIITPLPFHEIKGEIHLDSYMSEWHAVMRFDYGIKSIRLNNCTLHQPLYLQISNKPLSIEMRDLTLYSDIDISAQRGCYEPALLKGYNAFSIRTSSPQATIRFRNIIFPSNPKFEESFCEFNLQFNNCNFTEWINITDPLQLAKILFVCCSFAHISLDRAVQHLPVFKGCKFPKCNGRKTLSKRNNYNRTKRERILQKLKRKHPTDPKIFADKEHIYQNLKQQAQADESRLLASDWHFWEKYYCEKRIFTEGTAIEWLILRLYRQLSDYGESVGKAAGWLLIFIFTPIVIAYLSQLPVQGSGIHLASIAHQGLNYIPLATRTPEAGTWSRLFQVFWQVLITFQATLLGFALRNRYRR